MIKFRPAPYYSLQELPLLAAFSVLGTIPFTVVVLGVKRNGWHEEIRAYATWKLNDQFYKYNIFSISDLMEHKMDVFEYIKSTVNKEIEDCISAQNLM